MGKSLVIAEKPSVASDIAKALGGFSRKGDYYESDKYIVSSAVGHLLEICEPEEYRVKKGKWSFENLPIIPNCFDLHPIESSEDRLKLLIKLINRKDVEEIINACDAGREGELIFRLIIKHSGTNKPIKRLWLQSMTAESIREGFRCLRSNEEMLPLAEAAFCRSEADWLVGINGTRAMTAFNSKSGGFQKTTVGRVQTPTLAIVVDREEKIRNFVPRDYWEIHATFAAQSGIYVGRWFDENFTKPKENNDSDLRPERLWSAERAEEIKSKCLGKPGEVTEESKPSTSIPPLLYDLTTLQREANNKYGFSASTTLKIAQALYEKHKVLTYPRTDSRALPEDYLNTAKDVVKFLASSDFSVHARKILEYGWVRPNKRVFNNAKISDHFAIIPTTIEPKHLNNQEKLIYEMVVKRFLAVFFPAAEYLITTRITRVEGEPFKTEGKVLVTAGWLEIYGKEDQQEGDAPSLPPVNKDEKVKTEDIEIKALQTKPPPRFTEATLLSAMEGAGKLIEDEDLRQAISDKGIGTPATRAAIIDGLLAEKYLERLGKELKPTPKAFSLITLLRGLQIPELISPEMTGDWEYKLKLMERGKYGREEFMNSIAEMAKSIVEKAKNYNSETVPGDFGKLTTPCPKCGGEVVENYKKFQCSKCDFYVWKIIAGRQFDIPEVEELIKNKQVGPLSDFRSKTGRPFSAIIKLDDNFKTTFYFENNGQKPEENGEPTTAPEQPVGEPLGKCPKCGAKVFENSKSYYCEKINEKNCDFKTSKIILQQPISREQMVKLLETGKTDYFEKFISKKRRRKFKARLILKKGNVEFEFEENGVKKEDSKKKETPKSEPKELNFEGRQTIGECPKCHGKVFEFEDSYICEKSTAKNKPCKFKINRFILNQEIKPDQATKLLKEGKTDLLEGFISRYNKPFKAYLVMNKTGKVTFEFPPKEK
ncbi:MAG: DNA topoisomerase III [Verrucomicrobiae bacterium]|nr:DNA topoisomerase III [Verrucomicrobiae bacterium]